MGYYTEFTLEVDGLNSLSQVGREKLYSDLERMGILEFYSDRYHNQDREVIDIPRTKWYEWEVEMLELSTNFPELKFTLWGNGEEFPDLWVSYFYRGELEFRRAEIVYPEPIIFSK